MFMTFFFVNRRGSKNKYYSGGDMWEKDRAEVHERVHVEYTCQVTAPIK